MQQTCFVQRCLLYRLSLRSSPYLFYSAEEEKKRHPNELQTAAVVHCRLYCFIYFFSLSNYSTRYDTAVGETCHVRDTCRLYCHRRIASGATHTFSSESWIVFCSLYAFTFTAFRRLFCRRRSTKYVEHFALRLSIAIAFFIVIFIEDWRQ